MAASSGEPSRARQQEEDGRERDVEDEQSTEDTPLLGGTEEVVERNDRSRPQRQTSALSVFRRLRGSAAKSGRRRWPSLLALLLLCVLAVLIIVFAFIAPSAVEQYAQQAITFEPTSLSIDSFLDSGVRARIQGDFTMDASRVEKKSVRDMGRFCTYIAQWAETGPSELEVILPEYGNVLLGTAKVPGIKLYIRNGHTTRVDFLANLEPGDIDGIRRIANDWIDGRLGQLRVLGKAQVPLKSGLISLGRQSIQQEMAFADNDLPSMPGYEIKKLLFREVVDVDNGKAMAADVSLKVENDFPVDFEVPPLRFGILVDNCETSDDLIMLGDALTDGIHIQPKTDVELNVTGTVRRLPSVLTQDCPGTTKSPLDNLLGRYIRGKKNTVYVQGSDSPAPETPAWVTDIISEITVPVPVQGRTFGHLIKNFSLADTHFSLPNPWAEPGTPEADPRLSAKVKALVALPEEMNFNISVGRVRADANVFYKGKKLGRLDLTKWQDANSSRIDATPKEGPALMVQSQVEDAPLEIQDEDVFTDVIQALLFGKETVIMKVEAEVDVGVETALGEFAIRKIPADGQVPIKPFSPPSPSDPRKPGKPGLPPSMGNITDRVNPKLVDLRIVNTSETSWTIGATINATNPTNYSASIPYIDVHLLKNGSLLGHATARNLSITTGRNGNLQVVAHYEPSTLGGPKARAIGREMISQYISGWNTTITVQMHEQSFPSTPVLGRALSRFPIEVATPRIGGGGDGDDEDDGNTHFIRDSTMHLLSSSATFLLLSPLKHSTLYIEGLHAVAMYKGDEVGVIQYDEPFGVPPVSETPDQEGYLTDPLPVDWSFGSIGSERTIITNANSLRASGVDLVSFHLCVHIQTSTRFQAK
ncbi:Ribonucleoside-diphosphate reductase large chain [Lecanosticta acicola]|uniref:Ribonucleoside-diphosphate reductase large chain n=1 Tax=Lecanosticta acicola TaxID=111012 RepID=A0AAI8YTX0_9PEZI|nr:Ribonucleoside-diphosphate reductase large chain [Lecanosticta acicola]